MAFWNVVEIENSFFWWHSDGVFDGTSTTVLMVFLKAFLMEFRWFCFDRLSILSFSFLMVFLICYFLEIQTDFFGRYNRFTIEVRVFFIIKCKRQRDRETGVLIFARFVVFVERGRKRDEGDWWLWLEEMRDVMRLGQRLRENLNNKGIVWL